MKRFRSVFSENVDMTQGSVYRQVMIFALPLILTNLLQQFYNMADSATVGQFDSARALAAVGMSGAIVGLLNGFLMGFVNGAGIVVAQRYGAGDATGLQRAIHTTYAVSIVVGILLTVVGLICSPLLLELIHTPKDIFDDTLLYLRIYFAGSIPNSIYCFSAGILRSEGDSRNPLYFLAISGLINVILNLILVAGFHMGVAGVGIATVSSMVVSAVLSTIALVRCDGCRHLSFRELGFDGRIVRQLVSLGVPASIQSAMFAVSNICIQSSINRFGSTMVAGCTASSNIDGCLFQVTGAFAGATITFASQNYGAKNQKRIREGAVKCTLLGMGVVFLLGLLTTVFGRPLLSLFNSDSDVLEAGMARSVILLPTVFLYTGYELISSIVRGCGSSFLPMVISLVGVCFSRLAWIYSVLPFFNRIDVIFYSYPISYLLSLIMVLIYYTVFKKRKLSAV